MNMVFQKIVYFSLVLSVSLHCGVSPEIASRPTFWAKKMQNTEFNNLYSVDDNLFRSDQPSKYGMKELEKIGIKTVLSVRNLRNDKAEVKGTNIKLSQYRINTWTINYKEVVEALKIIKESPKPVLIHCKHGSDRTGCIVAAYRIAFQNWTKEEAINEFLGGGFGYHEDIFKNVLRLIKNIDVEKLKSDLNIKIINQGM